MLFVAFLGNGYSQSGCDGVSPISVDLLWEDEPAVLDDDCCYTGVLLSQATMAWDYCFVTSDVLTIIESDDNDTLSFCYDWPGSYNVKVEYFDEDFNCLGWGYTTIIVEQGCLCHFQLCWSVNGDGTSMQGIEEIVGIKVKDAAGVDHTVPFLVPPMDISAGFDNILDEFRAVLMASPFNLAWDDVGTDSTGCYKGAYKVAGFFADADFQSLAFYGFDYDGNPLNLYFTSSCPCVVETPTSMKCAVDAKTGNQVLSWEPVPNAVEYEVEQVFNDPKCCPTGHMSTLITTPRSTSMTSSSFEPDCFSWRVRSVCEDSVKSEWSETQCSCDIPIDDSGLERSSVNVGGDFNSGLFDVKVSPNPANDFVTITLGNRVDVRNSEVPTLIQPELIIYDIESRVVQRVDITTNEPTVADLSKLKGGIYLIKVIDNGTIISTQKLVIQ